MKKFHLSGLLLKNSEFNYFFIILTIILKKKKKKKKESKELAWNSAQQSKWPNRKANNYHNGFGTKW